MRGSIWFTAFLAVLAVLGVSGAAPAQSGAAGSGDDGLRLHPRLRAVAARALPELDWRGAARAISPSSPAGKRGREARYAVFVATADPDALRTEGIVVGSVYETFVTARVTARQLARMATISSIRRVEPAARSRIHNDVARGLSGARLVHRGAVNGTEYRGAATLTCVIDTGLDWRHLDFRSPSDTTASRVLSIWDQTLTAQSGEQTPADRYGGDFSGLDFGVEYTQTEIEDELDGAPEGIVRSEDTDGHGTHVAGTVAGNGASRSPGRYVGSAPRSTLVVVKAGNGEFSAANVVDGLTYCGKIADREGEPVAVNASLGTDQGPHDGTSFQARAVDGFVGGSNDRIVVVSAGNSGDASIHWSAEVTQGDSASLDVPIPSYSPQSGAGNDDVRLDLWWDSDPEVTARVLYSDSLVAERSDSGSDTTASPRGTVYISNETDVENGDRHLEIDVYDEDADVAPAAGTWTFRLINRTSSTQSVHAWLYDAHIGTSSTTKIDGGDGAYTVSSPATAERAIAVGSYAHRWRWMSADSSTRAYQGTDRSDDLVPSSSNGPRRDGVVKPDVSAPGQGAASALSSRATVHSSRLLSGKKHAVMEGTSMAAPVVAGASALLLEAGLAGEEVSSALIETAREDLYSGPVPNDRWGYGKVDVFQALSEELIGGRNRRILSYDQWGGSGYYYQVESGEKLAVRFTPDFDGRLEGVFVHTGALVSITDSVKVRIWDDSGGLPGAPLGEPSTFGPEALVPYTWNYLTLEDTGVDLDAGSDYHLVVLPTGSGPELRVLGEQTSVDGRSSRDTGAGWSSLSGDLRVRAEVAGPAGAATAISALRTTELPPRTELAQNYPNPFNPATSIRYGLPVAEAVTLRIYDALGRMVAEPVDGRRSAGWHTVRWNAGSLPSGLYFYRLVTDRDVREKAMMLVR